MVSKEVLKKIGVFAVAAMVAASPVLAVNANGGIPLGRSGGSGESGEQVTVPPAPIVTPGGTPDTVPTPTPTPVSTPAPTADNNGFIYVHHLFPVQKSAYVQNGSLHCLHLICCQDSQAVPDAGCRQGTVLSILVNQSQDPSMLSVETDGFGVFAIVKAPAGSFDVFRK